MQAGYLQFAPLFGEREKNAEMLERIATRHAAGADLLVLPELATTGYLFLSRGEAARLAEPFRGGIAENCFGRIARRLGAVVVGGFAEGEGARIYNACALVRPDGSHHIYRKAHLFLNEKEWFDPGRTPLDPVEGAGARIGLMICFDWYFPEVARTLALGGAEILCHPSNLVLDPCPDAMRTRALENLVFAVTANRVGTEERGGRSFTFVSRSQVVAPDGRILLRAPATGVHVGIAEIDPVEAREKKVTAQNDWTKDRRKDLFHRLVE